MSSEFHSPQSELYVMNQIENGTLQGLSQK